MKKGFIFLLTMSIMVFSFGPVSSFSPAELAEVEGDIIEIQGPVPGGTPLAPPTYDQKGYVGSVLGKIFDGVQKIRSEFIAAFSSIFDTTANNVPVWNGQKFLVGTLTDLGGNIGIGITTPATQLHVTQVGRFDGGVQVDGKKAISNTNGSHTTQSTTNAHYGFFETRDASGSRGVYFGHGDGGNRVDLHLDSANWLNISGGNVGIGTTVSPQAKLHVAGNIIANDPTADNHVATKSYVDLNAPIIKITAEDWIANGDDGNPNKPNIILGNEHIACFLSAIYYQSDDIAAQCRVYQDAGVWKASTNGSSGDFIRCDIKCLGY